MPILRRGDTSPQSLVGRTFEPLRGHGVDVAITVPPTAIVQVADIGGEWLKRTPSAVQQPGGRWQVVTEWVHAQKWARS
ncbi:MAG TPA: hypothetical protein PKE47_11895, partial [Verrucomicrobiota bacterium]|nr:hypothetical protein [Verrucomicrobiota bacterium]